MDDIRKIVSSSNVKFLKDSFKDLVLEGVTSIEEYDTIVNFD